MMGGAAGLILTGNAATAALLLVRNLLVARLIPVADYGIAATFAVIVALVEMISALGLQQQIVRDRQGEDPHRQAALQAFQLLRGVVAAAALWLLAGPFAHALGIADAAWAYRWLALVPLLNALVHFDIYRLNRQSRFAPMVLSGMLPAVGSLASVWPLSAWLGDYRVFLCALLLQAALGLLASHVMAERPYRLVLDGRVMRESLRFGWPVLVNGALLFAVFNGDRLIIGHALGMEALALLSLGLTLTLTPALVLERSAQTYFLPRLAQAQGDRPAFARLSAASFQAHLVAAVALVAGVLLFGPMLVGGVLAGKYQAVMAFLPWLAVQQGLRLAKNGNSPAALAIARTGVSLWVGLPRVAALGVAVAVALGGGDLMTLIQIGTAGEAAGFALSLWLTRRRLSLPLRPLLWPSACLAAVGLAATAPLPDAGKAALVLSFGLAALVTARELVALMRERAGR